MKRIAFLLPVIVITVIFSACGSQATPAQVNSSSAASNIESNSQNLTESSATSTSKDFPDGDYKDTGKGNFAISTPSGSSENGNVPIIFIDKNSVMSGLGIYAREFDGAKLSYVYVDGTLIKKDQYADIDTSINLKSQNITVGTHKVEIVQYDTDKPDGKLITYKTASYEVKSK